MPRYDLIALGECMVEMFEEPAGSGTYRRAVGGDTLNTLAMAARFGAKTAYVTLLADDAMTAPIRATLAEHGVDDALVKTGAGFNGLYIIEVDASGERRFHYLRENSAASRIEPRDVAAADVAGGRILFTSGITQAISATARATALHAARAAKAAGSTVAYDVNFRPRLTTEDGAAAALREIAPFVDVLFLSEDDVPVAAQAVHVPCGSPAKLARNFAELGVSQLVLKAGAAPVELHDRNRRRVYSVTPPRVTPVDTSGAGDVFNGAYLAALAQSETTETALARAAAAAALQVTAKGTLVALPDRDRVLALARDLPVVHRAVD